MLSQSDPLAMSPMRYVTDGGLETDLVFHHGVDLPQFAAYPLIFGETGRGLLTRYYRAYAEIARAAGAGLLLESPTWRANPDWGALLGHDQGVLDAANADSIRFLAALRDDLDGIVEIVISGSIGPRGDGYAAGDRIDPDDAEDYHRPQVAAFAAAGADRVTAYTLTDEGEAIGIARAAAEFALPAGISFTVEVDGTLPGGRPTTAALHAVVDAPGSPDLLLNCAHPSHLVRALADVDDDTLARIVGIRANASIRSHAELDEADELDEGDPAEFAAAHRDLAAALPALRILGGCCGTDARHVAALWSLPA